jgi:DNA helicase-2/ATP-dependent DNA helicase PcrA
VLLGPVAHPRNQDVPQRFFVGQQPPARGDRHVLASRSRFVPDALTPLIEVGAWPEGDDGAARADAASSDAPALADIAARVRALWR